MLTDQDLKSIVLDICLKYNLEMPDYLPIFFEYAKENDYKLETLARYGCKDYSEAMVSLEYKNCCSIFKDFPSICKVLEKEGYYYITRHLFAHLNHLYINNQTDSTYYNLLFLLLFLMYFRYYVTYSEEGYPIFLRTISFGNPSFVKFLYKSKANKAFYTG